MVWVIKCPMGYWASPNKESIVQFRNFSQTIVNHSETSFDCVFILFQYINAERNVFQRRSYRLLGLDDLVKLLADMIWNTKVTIFKKASYTCFAICSKKTLLSWNVALNLINLTIQTVARQKVFCKSNCLYVLGQETPLISPKSKRRAVCAWLCVLVLTATPLPVCPGAAGTWIWRHPVTVKLATRLYLQINWLKIKKF